MATRQVIDLPLLAAVITDHYRVKVRCKKCRRVTKGEWGPGSGTAPVTFGNGIRAHAVWLHDRHGVPVDRVAEIIGELTGITPSPGSILAWQAGVARSLRDYEARAALALLAADVVHADESGVGIGLEEKWIHVAATDTVVKYHVGNRGHEGVEAGEILDKTTAAVCSDDYATYTKYEEGWAAHLPCWAHWLRRLDRVAGLSGCKWAEELATEMRGAIHSANEARDRGRPWVSTREQQRVAARLTKLCAAGKKACAPNTADTGDNAVLRRRGLLLAKTIGSHDHALAFMADLSKPATNNAAEQALRYPKVILRGKAGWRSESAVEHKLVIAGYLETAARGGIDRLVALKDALSGTPYLPALV
jgi:transposase